MKQIITINHTDKTNSAPIKELIGKFHIFSCGKSISMRQNINTNLLNRFIQLMLIAGLLICSTTIKAQNSDKTEIKGFIRDAVSHEPIAAAQITTFNNEAAATTDDEGKFIINVDSKSAVLIITAFDYNQREIAIKGKSDLEIDLYSNAFSDDYSIVVGLSGKLNNSFNTQASSQIDQFNHSGSFSVDDPIKTDLGGDIRSISRSGLAGIGSSMFIRGLNSLNANAQPLFVVDGVIWNTHNDVQSLHDGYFINTLADIDLHDVESISVIKDGSSIYGSKAANGVIVINTVRGSGKATKITFNASAGVTQSPSSIPVMNKEQYRIYTTEVMGGLEGLDYSMFEFLNDDNNELSYLKYHNDTDWNNILNQTSTTQSYHINVNGGDDKALYSFSAGYLGNQGVLKTTNFNRLNTRFNADFNLTELIKMGLNIGFTNVDRVLVDDGVNSYTSPRYLASIKAPFLSPYIYTTTGTITTDFEDSDDFNVGNPLAVINNALNTSKHNRLNVGLKPRYQINENMAISSQFDYSLDKVKETYYSPMIGVANRYIKGYGVSENMFRSQQMRDITIFDDTRFSYINTFNEVHNIKAIAGWRYIVGYYESDFAEGHNSGTDQKRNLYSDQDYKTATGFNNHMKSISNYLNIDYNYQNKYFASVATAIDGSSKFGNETQGGFQLLGHSWGIFPSANLAWLASSEEFMNTIDFVDRLKVRASVGVTGNDDIDPYAWTTYFAPEKYINRGIGIYLANTGNTEIQWETTNKMSIGFDANLFNDRVALSFDLFNNTTNNLLSLLELPETSGNDFYLGNSGSLNNAGFELSTTVKVLATKTFNWEVNASIGHYKNKIKELPGEDYTTSIYNAEILTSVGNAAGVFYGYKTNGVIATETEALEADLKIIKENGTSLPFTAGDMLFEDLNDDHIIDENDKQIIGDPNPDIYGSFSSLMGFGKLSINALFTYSYGNDVYNYLRSNLESGSKLLNQSTAMVSRWTHEGQQTMMPKTSFGDPMGNGRFSDRWIEDGSYLKLKSLTVNYKLDLKNSFISGLTLSLSANNLITLTNYLGLDPEVSVNNAVLYQGIDTGVLPACRSYLIGIKMNL